jgi:shikimate kinase
MEADNAPPRRIPPIDRIVLLGFMCSGKSSVGEALARRLGWEFLDFDVEIERREGAAIRQIVDDRGEETLREMEAALTEEIAQVQGLVAAPGGGWITRPELLASLGANTFAAWLRVTPAETVRRLNEDTIDRPMRNDPGAAEQIAAIIDDREPLYRLADIVIPTDGRIVDEIAFEIESVIRIRGANC